MTSVFNGASALIGPIVHSLPTSVILLDKDKNLVECNQAACIIHQDIPIESLLKCEEVNDALDRGASGEYCTVDFCYDPANRWLRLNINPVYNDQGAQIGISIFEKDITAKKAMISHLMSLRGVKNEQIQHC